MGGALAEAILEDFYERDAFGIITTLANLKVLANELPTMDNANMHLTINLRTHHADYRRSRKFFTFEVAQKNGLPYSLINAAKKKIERGKVRLMLL